MEALAIAAVATMVTGAGVSIYSGYQANSAAKSSAKLQTSAAEAAANAQRMAAQAQADQARDQAELAGLQASVEDKKAGVAQQQGEIEARRRMVQLASDVGNAYAQWAGNGLLVDGGDDSLGHILTANAREAGQDVGVIKANAENAVWEHSMNKSMALLAQNSYEGQAENYSILGDANANATLMSGQAQAYATRQAGLTALYSGWGTGLGLLGSAGMASYNTWGGTGAGTTWSKGGAANLNNSGGWSSSSTPALTQNLA